MRIPLIYPSLFIANFALVSKLVFNMFLIDVDIVLFYLLKKNSQCDDKIRFGVVHVLKIQKRAKKKGDREFFKC